MALKLAKRILSVLTAAVTAGVLASALPLNASAELPSETAEFMDAMGAGWNLGNTLDAHESWVSGLNTETCWGNPKTTAAMIREVHKAGFETIRIPVTWYGHVDNDYKIDGAWLARVKEVVDYAYEDGMHVILNIHHDVLEGRSDKGYYPDSAHKDISLKYLNTVWSQIAEEFKDYDEKLIFETLNEPRLVGDSLEWSSSRWVNDSRLTDSCKVINEFNQAIVDLIRASGGNNATRYIMAPGYAASADSALADVYKLPTDPVSSNVGKIVVSTHAYTPYELCLTAGKSDFDSSAKQSLDGLFNDLNNKFISKGIPVIMGETGITYKNNQTDCDNWAAYYYGYSEKYDIPCVVWDNGVRDGGGGECHAHLNRNDLTWYDPTFVSAIMNAVTVEKQPEPTVLYGDVDNSGAVDMQDLALLQQYLAKWDVSISEPAADVDCNGELNMLDLALLQQFLAHWDVKLGK